MPCIVARPVVSLLRRSVHTKKQGRRAAKCGQQFPPSDGDCHTPLPCEVRKGNDNEIELSRQLRCQACEPRPEPRPSPPQLGESRHFPWLPTGGAGGEPHARVRAACRQDRIAGSSIL